jgi:hypothetical protein
MSLDGFQRAVADLVASPRRCIELRQDPTALDRVDPYGPYDLDERERRRLLAMVRHAGMSHHCTLYRANRLTPIGRGLPQTCELLGDRLSDELDTFWEREPDGEIQFRLEAERFVDHLHARLRAGELDDTGDLAAVLAIERAELGARLGSSFHP